MSDTVLSSDSVTVAVNPEKFTSVTVAVHFGFGHDPGGAEGAALVMVNLAEPFLGVGWGPLDPTTVVVKF